ncbi:MAG: hypothetical protein ACREPN_06570 [Rudaea sp.]
MKRTSLTTAVIAGLAGVAGIANMAGAVNLSTDGTGSVLIYPYYTVNGNNVTLLSVVNTTSEGKAVKVRFLEAYNSREVLDFNLYMSPFDVWTAEVDPVTSTGGASISTGDNSCTVPTISGSVPFVNYAYSGNNSDTGPTDLSRTTEGYVEMIEMGTVNDNTSGSLTAITHVNGVPASCGQVLAAWAITGGSAAYWTNNSSIDIGAPDGGLFGSGTIVNVGAGTIEGYNADAVEGFYAGASANQHTAPGNVLPNLASGTNPTAFTFNTTGTGNVTLATTTFSSSIDAVSAVFMTDSIYNEYVVDPAYGESTEWVITFPTKRFYVDPQIIGSSAVHPFDEVFGSVSARPGTSCSPVSIVPYNREEATTPITAPPIGFSPPPPGTNPNIPVLCWETNVITFNEDGTVPSTVLGSSRNLNVNLPTGFIAGWVNLGFDDQSATTPVHNIVGSSNANTFQGLPATGFSVEQTINSNVSGGVLANYTGLYNHKYNRVCGNGGGACS